MSETQEPKAKDHSLHIRIPMEVYEKIKARAAQNYISANKLILSAVLREFGDAP